MAHVSSDLLMDRRQIAFDMRGLEITYHAFSEKHIALKTGKYTPTYTDTTIDQALVGFVDLEMIKESGGKYQKGDRAFKIKTADLPETPPSLSSQITYSSIRYQIIDHVESGDGNVFLVIGRKI